MIIISLQILDWIVKSRKKGAKKKKKENVRIIGLIIVVFFLEKTKTTVFECHD